MPGTAVLVKSYPKLLDRIKKTIESGRKQIELTKALTYWKIGEDISKHMLSNNFRAGYGDRVYRKLSKDLGIDARTLRQTVQFHREIPNVSARSQLDWTHYRKLITVDDPLLRNRLLKRAEKNDLTTRELGQEIKRLGTPAPRHTKLIAKRGELNIYQIISSDVIKPRKGRILIDYGFNFASAIKRTAAKPAQLVKTRGLMSFTYKAYPQKVIDGDTLWVVVDLGLGNFTYQKLRLRGIDTPELTTKRGKYVQDYVKKLLDHQKFIIVKTYKDDKYGRMLADVFYLSKENDPEVVAEKGIYLNQELLDKEMAEVWI